MNHPSHHLNPDNTYACSVLDIDDLPPALLDNPTNPVSQIAAYLKQLVNHHAVGAKGSLLLPSVEVFAGFFRVPPHTVWKALAELREQGYYSISGGLYGHVTLWNKHNSAQTRRDHCSKQRYMQWSFGH